MMVAKSTSQPLVNQLPKVRGTLTPNAPLGKLTWFGVGGPAEVLFQPADMEDLANFLATRPSEVQLTIIGATSNLLIRDGGIPGVVIRLGTSFADITVTGSTMVCGSASLDTKISQTALTAGRGGLEFLFGIPGTLGGAIRMNAGAYGSEIKNVLLSAEALDENGGHHILDGNAMAFDYRRCGINPAWIFTRATLRAEPDDITSIETRMQNIRKEREQSQPLGARTGGSTFANPAEGRAWELLDRSGCRGLRRGGALISEKHCNFMINAGTATAADLEDLGEEARQRVLDTTGIDLHWEIRCIGVRSHERTAP